MISIHAPVKGATRVARVLVNPPGDISIHAPVKGATKLAGVTADNLTISIHAPVKGATFFTRPDSVKRSSFQSTHP